MKAPRKLKGDDGNPEGAPAERGIAGNEANANEVVCICVCTCVCLCLYTRGYAMCACARVLTLELLVIHANHRYWVCNWT